MSTMDRINRATWAESGSLRLYRKLDTHLDPGERAAFDCALARLDRPRILDLGVGGGRTTGLLAPRARDYVGIDYMDEMIAESRARWPDRRFERADARDLSRFADGAFDLVVFSCNGIDSVDADGRGRVLAEAARVLAPGGLFVFSTFNMDGPGFAGRINNRRVERTLHPVRLAWSLAKYLAGGVIGLSRVARRRRLEQRFEDHAILLHRAHDFGILVHATTLPHVEAQLRAAGLVPWRAFGDSGRALTFGAAPDRAEEYFHLIAEKPAAR